MSIVTDEKILRTPSVPIDPEKDNLDELIAELEKELSKSAELGRPGIGLAAIQIGIPKKVAIVRIYTSQGQVIKLNLVNCKIAAKYDEIIVEEGCLSFPGRYVKIKRFNEIYVVDNLVEPHEFVITGLGSICVQHELDHINGITIFDS